MMAGPFCETCDYYRPMPFGSCQHGECNDPDKIIYTRTGRRVNTAPEVRPDWECSNHSSDTAYNSH